MINLISRFEHTMNEKRFTVGRFTNKKLRKKIKDEFCTSAAMKTMKTMKEG